MVDYTSSRIQMVQQKGKQFLYLDFSDLYGDRLTQEIINLRNFVLQQNIENISVLLNITNSYVTNEIIKEIRTNTNVLNQRIHKAAIVGNSKVQDIFIKFIRNFIHIQLETFIKEESGKEWLVTSST